MITAPYNFVPLNKEVFYPDWSEDVSHDIPFKDGESGEIDITITAKSPIFIRDHNKPEEFCQHNGVYYIPSSSIKGMVRNVLEIMSFSKMRDENFDDNTYAVRDLSHAKNFYMQEMKEPTFGGWLRKVDGQYIIEDCGEVGRISHEEIDKALNIEFAKHFKDDVFDSKNKEHKSSKYKYDLIGHELKTITLSEPFRSKNNAKIDKRVFYNYDKNGKKQATLVLTGQPSPRKVRQKKSEGKGYEFLFFDAKGELTVSKEVMDNFKFAYFDNRTTEPKESPDWAYWKKKLEDGEKVPVFFQKNGNTVKHFGLSYLYKLPYSHSVKDGIPKTHFESTKLDLAQTIFGYISKNSQEALKGRVQFSHFKATQNIEVLEEKEILGTPRASYYPNYIRQTNITNNKVNKYITLMNDNAEISGRKRYPIHSSSQPTQTTDTGNENVGTSFKPLEDGVVFKGKMRFHNLKKAEIGALLSALTFHNTPNTFHNIGLAKSLGYGKIALKLDGVNDINSYLKAFESAITEQIPHWASSNQLQELVSMATEQPNKGNSKLKYMQLKEFAKNKTDKERDYLRNYTALDNIKSVTVKSLLSDEEIAKVREEKAKAKKEQQDLQEALTTDNIQIIKNFIEAYPNHPQTSEFQNRIAEIEKAKLQSQFAEVNEKAQKALEAALSQKNKNVRIKWVQAWIKKWEKPEENKGSSKILELVEQAKKELKIK